MRKADNERRSHSAEKLFDAVGMIDDRLIAEAAELRGAVAHPSTRKRSFLRRYAVSLTALLLVFMMIGGFVVANLSNFADHDSLNEGKGNDMASNSETRQTLDFVLSNAMANEEAETLSFEEIDFFDGAVSLIWSSSEGGDNEYRKLTFGQGNIESDVKNCMSKSVEQIPPEIADDTRYMVWVSYGNGEVVSPYLKESAGNIGYATLFDYSPEVMPSDSFTDLVSEALMS